MALEISCPSCGEGDEVVGSATDSGIQLRCGQCGTRWMRDAEPTCSECGGTDLQTVPLAIVEKSRGTQLSIMGTRPIDLCSVCDQETLRHYHDHRPSPLMPTDLPTVGEEQMNG